LLSFWFLIISCKGKKIVWESNDCKYILQLDILDKSNSGIFYGSFINKKDTIHYKAICKKLTYVNSNVSFDLNEFYFSNVTFIEKRKNDSYQNSDFELMLPSHIKLKSNDSFYEAQIFTHTSFSSFENCIFRKKDISE